MPYRRICLLRLLAIVFAGCGCSSGPGMLNAQHEYSPADFETPIVSESTIDSLNLYQSTVKVHASVFNPVKGHVEMTCSGVLVDSRVVLTAGHCVCDDRMPKPPEPVDTTFIDQRSLCAKTATVRLLTYRPVGEGDSGAVPANMSKPYIGTAHPHESIKITYKEMIANDGRRRKTTLSSNADLAAIILNESLEGTFADVKLATEQVRRYEQVTLVGFGLDSVDAGEAGKDRRYGENYVLSIKSDGTTFHIGKQVSVADTYDGERPGLMRSSGAYALQGDSGGPCFRKNGTAMELVGIAKSFSAGDFMLSSYTSTPKYLEWIRRMIAKSKTTPTE